MEMEKISARISAKQELINIERDQNKKNELIQDLSVLQMRKDMEETKQKIKKITENY